MGRGSCVTNPGFVCVMGFGCYNGGAVTCHGGAVGCGCYNGGYGKWSDGRGGGGGGGWLVAIVLCSCFIIIILMSSLYYLNEMV